MAVPALESQKLVTKKLLVSQILNKKNCMLEAEIRSHSFGSRERCSVSKQADQGTLNFAIY